MCVKCFSVPLAGTWHLTPGVCVICAVRATYLRVGVSLGPTFD